MVWPFSRRKKSQSDQQPQLPPTSRLTQPLDEKSAVVSPLAPPMTPRSRQPTPAAAPPSRDSPRTGIKKSATEPAQPISTAAKRKTLVKKHSRSGDDDATQRQPLAELRNQRRDANSSRTSLSKDADFSVVPTLKPNGQDGKSLRSKKSIRSKGDKERIKSLRNGSSPIPIPGRPLSDASGELMVREVKRASNGFGRPTSQVSLPLAESLRDEFVPDAPESTNYKLNAFDVLAPRPTIKYSTNTNTNYAKKEKEPIISDGDFGPKARVNDLADDLDARGLRELMDRDRRRRERKRKVDTDKHADKLARKLESKDETEKEKRPKSKKKDKGKEKAWTEATSTRDARMTNAKSRSATPEALPTVGGPLEDNPFWTTDDLAPISPVHAKFRESRYSPVSPIEDPFAEPPSAVSDKDDPIVETLETARAVRLSQASMSPPSSPVLDKRPPRPAEQYQYGSSTPDIPELPEPAGPSSTATSPEPPRRDPEASSARAGGGWTSIFRRTKTKTGKSSDRGRTTPSESGFSNTSRESFRARTGQSTGPSAAALAGSHRSFRRSDTPQRTQSKFREELPDVPKVPEVPAISASVPTRRVPLSPPRSPPASRGASPDLSGPPSPYVDRAEMLSTDAAVNAPMDIVHPALRGDVALSRHQSMRSSGGYNGNHDSGPSAALLSQSLASVDSEGSWLSGRPSKRSSSITAREARTGSKTSLLLESSEQESTRASPLMFGRRISNPGQRPGTGSISTQLRQLRQPSIAGSGTGTPPEHSKPPTPIPFSGPDSHGEDASFEKGDALLHTGGIARTPTLVNRERAMNSRRSREGLLDIFDPRPQSSSAAIELAGAEDEGMEDNVQVATIQPPARNPLRGSISTARGGSSFSASGAGAEREGPQRVSTATSTVESPGDELEQAQFADAKVVQVGEITEIKRATSVSLRNRTHARQMSAGSAKLLDLTRSSGEIRRSGSKRESLVDTPTTPRIPEAFRGEESTSTDDEKGKEKLREGAKLFK